MLEANPGRCLFATLRFDADHSATADPARHRARRDRDQRRRNASLLLSAAGQQRRSAANRHWRAGRETPRNWVTAVERKQEGPTGCQPPIPAASMRKRAKPCRRWCLPGPITRWDCMRSTLAGCTPSTVPTPTLVSGCASARVHPPAQ